jgi:hypothetical protein
MAITEVASIPILSSEISGPEYSGPDVNPSSLFLINVSKARARLKWTQLRLRAE